MGINIQGLPLLAICHHFRTFVISSRTFSFNWPLGHNNPSIPLIQNRLRPHESGVIVIGAIASLLFLCYKAWVYESFFSWIIDMAGWGIGAYLGFIGFMFITYGRCDHCGHFGLSRMGRTKRFDDAVDHFRFLNADGSDLKDMPDNGEVKNPQEVRCAHCFEPSISATNH